ncbi:MAG: toll/interleukin-1 receptor domain-containing protein [Ginsengibacter sp.]
MILEKIFFSYSRADASDFALRLALDLKKEGFNVWIDQEDIRAGSEWDLEIEKALETCDCLLFIETEKSVTSNNVLDEVYYALEEKKKVIPVILVDSKTPFRLQRLQHIDFSKNYNAGLGLLINELRDTTAAQAFTADETRQPVKIDKPFYKKPSLLLAILALLIVIIAAIFIYASKNNKTIPAEKDTIINTPDTIKNEQAPVDTGTNEIAQKEAIANKDLAAKNSKVEKNKNPNNINTGTIIKKEVAKVNLTETFAGDWRLAEVDPKAKSKNGYIKIEAIDAEKATIKSYMQFYYLKTNDTSFLTVFNAFAGCASCTLARDMKIKAEDVAVASQFYKIDEQTGETLMNAGANKSIRASVTLQFLNSNTAIIKIQQAQVTELSHGLILQPFVYTFHFTKVED